MICHGHSCVGLIDINLLGKYPLKSSIINRDHHQSNGMPCYDAACGKQCDNSLGCHSLFGCTKNVAPPLCTALLTAYLCVIAAVAF